MTMEELISEYRGYLADCKTADGKDWADAEMLIRPQDLEALLDEIEAKPYAIEQARTNERESCAQCAEQLSDSPSLIPKIIRQRILLDGISHLNT